MALGIGRTLVVVWWLFLMLALSRRALVVEARPMHGMDWGRKRAMHEQAVNRRAVHHALENQSRGWPALTG